MKNFKFLIILFLLVVILFSLFKYASDKQIIENMPVLQEWDINNISDIVNNNPPTSEQQKINGLESNLRTYLNKTRNDIRPIIKNNKLTNAEKIEKVKKYIKEIK
jgi:predicted PurR-regulated permease PerM